MDWDFSQVNRVRPPQATVFPSGEMATETILPASPSSIGGLRILISLPVDNSHTRTVLSMEPVTKNLFCASIPILLMSPVCTPVSMRRIGSFGTSDECTLSTSFVDTAEPSLWEGTLTTGGDIFATETSSTFLPDSLLASFIASASF